MVTKKRVTKRKYMNIEPKFLKAVLNGTKKGEIRSWYQDLDGKYFGLRNTETKKVEAVILIGEIFNLKSHFSEYEQDIILSEMKVDKEFREKYDCRYLYTIKEVHKVQ